MKQVLMYAVAKIGGSLNDLGPLIREPQCSEAFLLKKHDNLEILPVGFLVQKSPTQIEIFSNFFARTCLIVATPYVKMCLTFYTCTCIVGTPHVPLSEMNNFSDCLVLN